MKLALSTSIWSAVFNFVDKLDLNTSEIEKIETKFRIARKVNIWVISPIFLLTALVLSYYITIWIGSNLAKYSIFIFVPSMFIGLGLSHKSDSKPSKKKNLYLATFFIYLATISGIVMAIGYILILSTIPFELFFSWVGLLAIVLFTIYVLGCYFLYKIVNIFLASFPEMFSVDAIQKPIVYITTSNNSSYSCILLNITKRGDYIIKPLKSKNDFIHNENLEINLDNALKATYEEILLNRLHIVDIKYLGESQSLKDIYGEDIANKISASVEKQTTNQ